LWEEGGLSYIDSSHAPRIILPITKKAQKSFETNQNKGEGEEKVGGLG